MKRDVAIVPVPFQDHVEIVIACDNSGSIGMKQADDVTVPYETVGYYSFRVAYMECVAAKAVPFSVTIHNFSGDEAWFPLVDGVKVGMNELGIEELAITGSTETNFTLSQSAVGITVLGRRLKDCEQPLCLNEQLGVAVIGRPLVGQEVIEQREDVAPLQLFQEFSEQEFIVTIVPVGSKGISYEVEQIFPDQPFTYTCELGMKRTSGPATSFIIVYLQSEREKVEQLAGKWFYPIEVDRK